MSALSQVTYGSTGWQLSDYLAVTNNSQPATVCFVCGCSYRQPRILPCLHTFCTDCILSLDSYPAIGQHTDSADAIDLSVSGDSSSDIGDRILNVIQPPSQFSTSGVLWGTPPRSRHKQRQTKILAARSHSCDGRFTVRESHGPRRHRSANCGSVHIIQNNSDTDVGWSSDPDVGCGGDNSRNGARQTPPPATKTIIMCPICWKEVLVSATLKEVPRNLMAERFAKQNVLQPPGTVPVCDLCHDATHAYNDDDNTGGQVRVRCLTCCHNLCPLCETAHRRQRRSRDHRLVKIDQWLNSGGQWTAYKPVSDSMSTLETGVLCTPGEPGHNSASRHPADFLAGQRRTWQDNGGQNLVSTAEPAAGGRDLMADLRLNCARVCGHDPRQSPPSTNMAASPLVSTTGTGQGHTATCPDHLGQPLKMFCVTCELAVCLDCVLHIHRTHNCQFVTRELFQNQMDDVQKLIHATAPKVRALDDLIESLTQAKIRTVERAHEVKDEVNTYMDNFISSVELHRAHLLSQVTSLCESNHQRLCLVEETFLQARADVGATCDFLGQLLTSATDLEILALKPLLRGRLTSLKDMSLLPYSHGQRFLRFCPSMKGDVINNFQMFGRVIANQPSAVDSHLHGDGLSTARLARKCSMVLSVSGCDGLPYTDNDVTIDVRVFYQQKEINLPVKIVHLTDGAHDISFTPVYEGTHFLHVCLNGSPVQDSPFKFHVKPRWRQHLGTWSPSPSRASRDTLTHDMGISTGGPRVPTQGQPGPGHWSCCGKMTYSSECAAGRSRYTSVRQATF